jgi:hypothetical protein
MIGYQRNNIIFRIAASDAISKFKAIQMHSFIQLSRSDISFDVSARETVLLEYDRFSQWLYRTERNLLGMHNSDLSTQFVDSICETIEDEFQIIDDVMKTHSDVFSSKVIEFTKIIHNYSVPTIRKTIAKIVEDKNINRIYTNIVTMLSDYLQHLLMSMHEFNNNIELKMEVPFLSFSKWSGEYDNSEFHYYPLMKRAEYFSKTQQCIPEFVFKNYTDNVSAIEDVSKALFPFGITLVTKP